MSQGEGENRGFSRPEVPLQERTGNERVADLSKPRLAGERFQGAVFLNADLSPDSLGDEDIRSLDL